MRNWIISTDESSDTYLIASTNAIWLSEQEKGVNIEELIEAKKLANIKSVRYEDLKEIIFIDSDCSIEFNYRDDKEVDEEFKMNTSVYREISSYLKSNLKGTKLKNYGVFNQIFPQLSLLAISSILVAITYFTAIELESGNSVRIEGRRAWLKRLVSSIAEVLGSTATLIIGASILVLIAYFIIRKIQHPKTGEVLQITKAPQLSI